MSLQAPKLGIFLALIVTTFTSIEINTQSYVVKIKQQLRGKKQDCQNFIILTLIIVMIEILEIIIIVKSSSSGRESSEVARAHLGGDLWAEKGTGPHQVSYK